MLTLLILTASFVVAPAPADDTVDGLLAAISGGDASRALAGVREFLAGGEDAFGALVTDVVDQTSLRDDAAGKAAIARDAKARSAISGLVYVATRPGGEAERRTLAPWIVEEALRTTHSVNVRRFFLEQSGYIGDSAHAQALRAAVLEEAVSAEAIAALQTIGGDEARQALRTVFAVKPGAAARAGIVQALGALRDVEARSIFLEWARGDEDPALAYVALGRIGDIESVDLLFGVTSGDAIPRDRRLAAGALIEIAAAHEVSAPDRARELYDRLWSSHTETRDRNVRIVALKGLARLQGLEAMPRLLAALASDDPQMRAAVIGIGASMPGAEVTASWIRAMAQTTPAGRIGVIELLARRGDGDAIPAVRDALAADEPAVVRAAMTALVSLAGGAAVSELVPHLGGRDNDQKDLRKHAIDVLTHGKSDDLSAAVAASLATESPAARRALLEILTARRARDQIDAVFRATSDADASVRRTALVALGALAGSPHLARFVAIARELTGRDLDVACQNLAKACSRLRGPERAAAVVTGLESATAAARVKLVGVLVAVGDDAALAAVRVAMQDDDTALRDAAVRALASWPTVAAIDDLLGIAAQPEQEAHGVLALRGCVRLLETSSWSNRRRVDTLRRLLEATDRLDERRLILTGLSRVRSVDALLTAARFLDDAALRREAEFAITQIACPRNDRDRGLRAPEVATVLGVLVAESENEKLVENAAKHLRSLPDAQGFVPLFNGRDLDGWQGAVGGYAVENGTIVCRKGHGGNLFTASEYGDFVLSFEFQLAEGSNNGLGLRTPLEGDPAYVGMESQILDNTAEKFRNLQPYQYHGSIYGVVPAKRGHLAPVGSWNEQVVSVDGRQVKITLNDVVIVDANLDEASAGGTIDGRDHPGLARDRGYLGFLGHGDWVAFRNIRVKVLD